MGAAVQRAGPVTGQYLGAGAICSMLHIHIHVHTLSQAPAHDSAEAAAEVRVEPVENVVEDEGEARGNDGEEHGGRGESLTIVWSGDAKRSTHTQAHTHARARARTRTLRRISTVVAET